MEQLTQNLHYLFQKEGENISSFLAEQKTPEVRLLSLDILQSLADKFQVSLENLLFSNLAFDKEKVRNIKFLILDVDGVMTDGGMYFTENGDQLKKYNTKDGMGIMALHHKGIKTGIISSGFKLEMVKARADLLKIDKVYVGREPKMKILLQWLEELKIELAEVAIIGDDINDLEIMRNVGFSAAPSDAVPLVKKTVDVVLNKKGGEGCVRELIDGYLLEEPIT